jgi:hypothetical protein
VVFIVPAAGDMAELGVAVTVTPVMVALGDAALVQDPVVEADAGAA